MPIKKIHYKEIDSTQEEIRRLLRNDNQSLIYGEILLVSADHQTQGRGRYGRKWISAPSSGLYFSFAILLDRNFSEEHSEIEFAEWVTREVGLSLISTLQKTFGEALDDLYLKPVNDIYYADKKLAGILVEIINHNSQKFLIVGIGINLHKINQEEIEATNEGKNALAISLEEIFFEQKFNLDYDPYALPDLISKEFLKKYSSLNQV